MRVHTCNHIIMFIMFHSFDSTEFIAENNNEHLCSHVSRACVSYIMSFAILTLHDSFILFRATVIFFRVIQFAVQLTWPVYFWGLVHSIN